MVFSVSFEMQILFSPFFGGCPLRNYNWTKVSFVSLRHKLTSWWEWEKRNGLGGKCTTLTLTVFLSFSLVSPPSPLHIDETRDQTQTLIFASFFKSVSPCKVPLLIIFFSFPLSFLHFSFSFSEMTYQLLNLSG